ncbi:MAG: efflux RND transporter periplasmic adaptor subunit [Planctomycetota bacterium]
MLRNHLLAAVALSAPLTAQEPPPTPVRAVRAETRTVVDRERVTGSLRAASNAALAAREDGAVVAVEVREGAEVSEGDVLVRLDARRLQALRAQSVAASSEASATALRREAEVDDARLDLAALEKASSGEAISERELRQARTRLAVAEADARAAEERSKALQAEIELLDIRVADMTLRAPFDGVVVERHVEQGEWVVPGDPMISLVSTSRLEVWLDVPQRLVGRLANLGSSVRIQAGAADHEVVATAPRVVPRIDPATRMFPFVAAIEGDAAAGLSPGMSASAYVSVGEEIESLMVPKDALVYRPGGVAVMVVMGEDEGGASLTGIATMLPAFIEFETDREVALSLEGPVRPGAVVIVEGNERLFPGMPVAASIDALEENPIR